MEIASLIEVLGQRCGTTLAMKAGGTLAMNFEGDLAVNLEHDADEDTLHVYVVLGEDPANDGARLASYRMLLEANLFGHDTAGGAIAVDPARDEILMSRRIELGLLDGDLLHEMVQGLVRSAVDLKTRLANTAAGAPSFDDVRLMMGVGGYKNLMA